MLNTRSNPPISTTEDLKPSDFSRTERILYWTAVLTPFWWLLGIQVLFYPAVVIVLLILAIEIDKLIRISLPACNWAWLAMSLVMLWTAILGIFSVGFSLKLTAATLVTFFKSYFLIFCGLTLPFWTQVRSRVITRAVVWMAIGFLVIIAVQMALLAVGVKNATFTPPLARVIPGDASALVVKSAKMARFFGVPLPRSVLHTQDPPILGACSLLTFVICLGETDRRLRNWALAGAGCALLVSFSRLAWICLPLVPLIAACFRSKLARQLHLWLAALTALICSFLELTLKQLIEKPQAFFDSARADSSETRAIVIRETIEAWQEKPWLGWGIIRGKAWLYENAYITLGSFSTYAAVLYLHGIVGFIIFLAALVLSLVAFYEPARRGNILCQRAFGSLVVLYILIQATPLSWMAVYFWFFFVWLGAVMREAQPDKVSLSWEELSGQY
jgi:hypothetical protein